MSEGGSRYNKGPVLPIDSEFPAELAAQIQADRDAAFRHAAFLHALKQAVALAGAHHFKFAKGVTVETMEHKTDIDADWLIIQGSLGVLSPSERRFLLALLSFYNADHTQAVAADSGFEHDISIGSLAASMGFQHKHLLSELMLNYSGW